MDPAGVQLDGGVGVHHRAHLGQGGVTGAERARVVQPGALQDGRGAGVGRAEQPLQPGRQPLQQRAGALRLAQLVDGVQGPPPRGGLPHRARLVRGAVAAAAHVRLQAVGQPRLAQQARRAQVGQQVVGRPLRAGAAQQRQEPPPHAAVGERQRAVHGVRDPVGAEDLLHQRGVGGRVVQHHRHVARLRARAQEADHLRPAQLELGPLAAGAVQGHGVARVGRLGARRLEQRALQGVQRVARAPVVVVADRGTAVLLPDLGQPGPQRGRGLERDPPGLERQRDHHVRVLGQLRDRPELQLGEVVEAVDEHRGRSPAGRVLAQRPERSRRVQVLVHQAGGLHPGAVTPVQVADLVRVRAPRPVARPGAQGLDHARRLVHHPLQLGDEAQRGLGEARPRRRLGQHVEPGPADGALDHQELLEVGRDPARGSPPGARPAATAARSAPPARRRWRRSGPARGGDAPRRRTRAPPAPAPRRGGRAAGPARRPPWRRWRVRLRGSGPWARQL